MLTIKRYVGDEVIPHLPKVASLRIQVFREFPYLYDGTLEYEESYLKTYALGSKSVFVLIHVDDQVVGVSTGIPLSDAADEFKGPFSDSKLAVESIFYFGESVLLPEFRGRGIGVRFFEERERHARELGFGWATFCAVVRPDDHPERPQEYRPLDGFWGRRGYTKQGELRTHFSWKELGEEEESEKEMVYWLRRL